MNIKKIKLALLTAAALMTATANAALVATPMGPFANLDDGYTASIFSLSSQGFVGVAWDASGNLWRSSGGSGVYVHSAVADTTVNGSNTIHSSTFHTITGTGLGGFGMTLGLDGFIYAQSSDGLRKINTTTFVATTIPGTAGGYYGIKTLPNGNIVHNDGGSGVYVYDPLTGVDTLIYNSGTFNDDVAVTPDGHILIAALGSCRTDIITSAGVLVAQSATAHCADGMAYGGGNIFKNNTDGTLTKLSFAGANYSGAVTETIIANGFGYGDLAAVGPDNAFYINVQSFKFANGSTGGGYALMRVEAVGGGGFGNEVPEPGSLALVGLAIAALGVQRKRMTA